MHEPITLEDEDRKLSQIKQIVDEAAKRITNGDLSYEEALSLAQSTRARIEKIVPDMMDTYDLIYAARFRRLMEQFIQQDES